MDRRRRARVGAVAAGGVEDHVVAAGDALVVRVHRALGGVDRVIRRAGSISSSARAGSTVEPDGGGVDDRVEVAAEGHVVGDRPEAVDLDGAVARVQERRDVADRHRLGAPVAHGDARLDEPRRRVEAHDGLGLGDRDHARSRRARSRRRSSRGRTSAGSRETSMNSTPQSASSRVGRLQDRPRHRRVPARLAHQQEPQVVALGLEAQLALEHRRARERPDAAVMTRVGMPSVCESTAAR